jgi:hypothetical protein
MMGYSVFFYLQQHSLEKELARAIDNNRINEQELIVIKIPITFYPQGNRDYERVEGSIQHQGKFYEMVKRKIDNDTIYVYCLPNEKKEKLFNRLADHIQTHVADISNAKTPESSKQVVLAFIKEYLRGNAQGLPGFPATTSSEEAFSQYRFHLSSISRSIPSPPPKTA